MSPKKLPPKKAEHSAERGNTQTPESTKRRVAKSPTMKASAQSTPFKREHFWLGIRREFDNVRIFTAQRWPRVERPEYADLYCPNCGSLDCLAALRRGVSRDVVVRSDVDWAYTSDEAIIISAKTKECLENAAENELTYFSFQEGKYFVVWPTNVIEMSPATGFFGKNHRNALIYSTKSPCSECGRLMDGYIRPAEHDYSQVANLVALALPRAGVGVHFALICHDHIGDKLKAAGIAGWRRTELNTVLPAR